MRRASDFPKVHQQAAELTARLQQLIAFCGTGTREVLWAVQMLERKAAVARWRTGGLCRGGADRPRSGASRKI